MKLDSGHTVKYLSKEEDDLQKEKFVAYEKGVLQLEPGNWFFPRQFENLANEVYNFKFRSTDVMLMTYPKCGTTWTAEIIWTMMENPNLDNPLAETDGLIRVPFLEADFITDSSTVPPLPIPMAVVKKITGSTNTKRFFLKSAEVMSDPRILKTHLPFSLFEKNLLDTCKIVYVMRNPKDVCVSYLHHHRLMKAHNFIGTKDEFVDFFITDKIVYSPYWEIMKEAWEQRNHKNMCILFYEKMKADPKGEISRLNRFLGTNLNEVQIENVIYQTSFSHMKKKEEEKADKGTILESFLNKDVVTADGGFLRKGITGDWKNKLTEDQITKIDDWTNEHMPSLGAAFKEISMY